MRHLKNIGKEDEFKTPIFAKMISIFSSTTPNLIIKALIIILLHSVRYECTDVLLTFMKNLLRDTRHLNEEAP